MSELDMADGDVEMEEDWTDTRWAVPDAVPDSTDASEKNDSGTILSFGHFSE